jgi:outer membrane protein, multidrug efflux system
MPRNEPFAVPSGRVASLSIAAILTALLSGCMVGPNYHTPSAPVPPAFKEVNPEPQPTGPTAIAYRDWWKVFHDPALDDLEKQADAANRDIKIAVAHVDEAVAATHSARSYLLPTIGADPSVSRNREAQNRPNNGNTNGHAATYNDIQLPLVASYEVDAWGRVRRSIESAHATQEATQADLRFVTLSVEATVAVDYYSLCETDLQLRIYNDTVRDLQDALQLTIHRFQGGVSSDLEVKQAQTLLDQTNAQLQALKTQRAQLEHALAVLLGRTVAGFSLPNQPNLDAAPQIPAGLPSQLLTRRPDIVEADRYIAAATAQIGIAKAAYFPQLSLTGVAGYESTNPTSLLNWQNTLASLAASATAPIFTGGRLRAGVDQAQATYRQSLAQYEKTVLTAYQEVEDQLAALHYLATQSEFEASAVSDSRQAEAIALHRYKSGLVSYLDVVYAQQTVLQNEQTAAQISGQRLVASVTLIKTLGGGWTGNNTP